jgi:uncharacterized damage-inducible protein DinB
MNQLLYDLYQHQAWADAEHWKAFDTNPKILQDEKLRKRVYHIYQVQRAFLLTCQMKVVDRRLLVKIQDMAILKKNIEDNHKEAIEFVKNISDEQLKEIVNIPWFKDPPLSITVEQALMQAAMHSHYHRGQNAARIRELGGSPPLTDLIIWYSKGSPKT